MAAVSATDVWAVGNYSDDANGPRGLIVHWDGTSWTQVAAPPDTETLLAVTASSASDVWAAGTGTAGQPLLLHNDGTGWVRTPDPAFESGGSGVEVNGIAATSASDAWAVGLYENAATIHPLILHWDGAQWSKLPSPGSAPGSTYLQAVSATSPDDAWAVGAAPQGDGNRPDVILHWDGHAAEGAMLGAGLVPSTTNVTTSAPGCTPAAAGTVIATSPPGGAFAPGPVTMTVCTASAPSASPGPSASPAS